VRRAWRNGYPYVPDGTFDRFASESVRQMARQSLGASRRRRDGIVSDRSRVVKFVVTGARHRVLSDVGSVRATVSRQLAQRWTSPENPCLILTRKTLMIIALPPRPCRGGISCGTGRLDHDKHSLGRNGVAARGVDVHRLLFLVSRQVMTLRPWFRSYQRRSSRSQCRRAWRAIRQVAQATRMGPTSQKGETATAPAL
jgi:hypothetical protein